MAEPRFKVGDFVIAKAQAEAIRLAPRRSFPDGWCDLPSEDSETP